MSIGAATQDGANPRDQFAWVERFAEIVVGPHFEADDTIDIFLESRQQNDRDCISLGSQVPAYVEAGPIRKHQVEDDKINPMGRKTFAKFAAARGEENAKRLPLDIAAEEFANFRVVVGDQDLWRVCTHGQSFGLSSSMVWT